MAADKITIQIDADTRKAITDLSKLEIATREAEKQASKFGASLSKVANADLLGWTSAMRNAAGAVAGLIAGTTALAARVETQERAINRLGASYHAVTAATNGVVSAQQALQLQQQIVQSGTEVSASQMAVLTRAAREYADATGTDLAQALDKVSNAIVNNSEDALQEFGIATARASTSTQTLANAVRELELRQRAAAPAARTLNEDLAKLPDSLTSLGAAAMRAAEGPLNDLAQRLLGISNATASFRQAIRELASAGDDQRALAAGRADIATRERRRQSRQGLINAMMQRGLTTSISPRDMTEEEANTLATLVRTGAGQDEFDNALSRLRVQRAGQETRARGAREADEITRRAIQQDREIRAAGPSRGGNGAEQIRSARDAFAEAVAEAMSVNAVLVTTDDVPRRPREGLAAYFTRLADLQKEFNSMGAVNDLSPTNEAELQTEREKSEAAFAEERAARERDGSRFQRIAARDRETRRRARTESFGGRVASGLGFTTDDEGRIGPFNAMTEGASALTSVVGTLTNGLTSLFDTLVTGSADAGTAFQAFASGLLSELGKMAVQKGLFYTFEGIAALFSAPPAAPLYFAAGAGLLALGAGLGFAGAAIKPQVPASAGGQGNDVMRGLAPRSASLTEGKGLGAVTVVMSSLVPAGPADAQRVRDGQRHASRMGFGDRVPRRVEF